MQTVYERYRARGLALVAVNIEPSQDAYGADLFASHGYSFTALRMPDPNWNDRYDVHEAPTNFLLDRTGKLVFHPRFGTEADRAISAQAIEHLLAARSRLE